MFIDAQTVAVFGAVLCVLVGVTSLSGRLFGVAHQGGTMKGYALVVAGLAIGVVSFWL